MKRNNFVLIAACLIPSLLVSGTSITAAQESRPAGWDDYSHGNDAAPDYAVVFPDAEVNILTISIAPENWQAMQEDMTTLYGEFGSRGGGGIPGGFRQPGDIQQPQGGQPPQGGQGGQPPQGNQQGGGPGQFPGRPGAPGFNPSDAFPRREPDVVSVGIEFNGQTWTHVGMRYKGNSSLSGTWGQGSLKLPFRLDFDEFEDAYPEIDNQRFFGFKELSFSSNFRDASYLHERVAADIYREAGVPAPQTAFYAVTLDNGSGPTYLGLFTAVEMVEDTVIRRSSPTTAATPTSRKMPPPPLRWAPLKKKHSTKRPTPATPITATCRRFTTRCTTRAG
ncbi:MAG: CotH kinase family protein [Chloroflexi bacterium]|nr:CotH kinase family protein [Chloroflexota bacterium]